MQKVYSRKCLFSEITSGDNSRYNT